MGAARFLRVFCAAVFAAAVSFAHAWAGEGAGSGGLPQLDVSLVPEQLFWLAITFGVLYAAMAYIALPRVTATKENRANAIAGELQTAQAASDSAQAMADATEKSLIEARAKAMAEINALVAHAKAESAARQAAQDRELLRDLHRAEADIAVAREAAMRSVGSVAAELAAAIVDKCLNSRKRVA